MKTIVLSSKEVNKLNDCKKVHKNIKELCDCGSCSLLLKK